jgi:adenylate cyclase
VVGEIGAPERTSYGVVGDGMNLASRLEGANKPFGTRILISEATRALAGDAVETREVDRIRVVGRRAPLRVFELLARKGELDAARAGLAARHEQALALFRARAWDAAEALLRENLERFPQDGPSAHLLARTRAARAEAPPPDWDATFELERK